MPEAPTGFTFHAQLVPDFCVILRQTMACFLHGKEQLRRSWHNSCKERNLNVNLV